MADNLNILLTAKLDYGKSESTIKSQVNSISKSINNTSKVTKDATKNMMSFGESIKTAAYKFTIWSGVTVAYYGLMRAIANGIETVKDLDTALVDLRKVTDETEASYARFADTAFETARNLARTGEEVIQATTNFARMGYSMQESLGLATEALELTNVADDIDNVNDSTSALIATMRGFQLEADSAGSIVDKLNEVSNKFGVTVGDLATGISKEAATLNQANNSLDQSIALITGGTEVMRDPARVATGLRTIALRIRGVSEEGEILEGLVPKLQSAFDKFGISLTDANGDFRSTYDILGDLASVYEDMSDLDLANISELVSGKRQSTVLNAVLQNWERINEAIQVSADSAGSAAEENAKYIDSIEGRIATFTSSVQNMWRNAISSDSIKTVVDLGTGLINLIDKVGLLNTAIMLFFTTMLLLKKQNFIQTIFSPLNAAIVQLVAKMELADGATKVLSTTLTTLSAAAIIGGIMLLVKVIKDASEHIQNMADDVAESYRQMEENKNTIADLGRQYEELAEKTTLTSDEKIQLLDIERQLKTAFGEAGDEIDLQTKSLEENKEAIEELTKAQAEQFLLLNQGSYEEALSDLTRARTDVMYFEPSMPDKEGNFRSAQAIRKDFEDLNAAIAEVEKSMAEINANPDISEYSRNRALGVLQNLYDERDALNDIKIQYENVRDAFNGIADSMDDVVEKQEAMTDSTWRNLESMETLASQFNSLTSNVNELYEAMDSLNTDGILSASTLDKLVEKYPEIIQYLHDQAQLQEFLTNKVDEYEATQLETYQNILMQSETFFNITLDGYEDFYNQLSIAYGADAENFKSLAEVKAETDDFLIEHLSASWAEYYDTQEDALRAVQASVKAQLSVFKITGSASYSAYTELTNTLKEINAQLSVLSTVSDAFNNLELDFTPINMSGIGSTDEDNTIIDAIEDLINSQIDALQDKIDAEQRIIDQLNEQYDKEKALAKIEQLRLDIVKKREELANIKKEKNVRLYNAATGQFEWVADPREVERAEEELSNLQEDYAEARRDYQHDMEVKKHQDMIDSYNKQINSLRDYLDTMEELTKKSVDEQLAEWNRLQGGNGGKSSGSSSSSAQNTQSQIDKLQEELYKLWLRYHEVKNSGYTLRTEAYNALIRKREEITRLGGIPAYEKGGKVPNTGPAILHQDEIVLNKPTAQLWERTLLPALSNIVGMLKGQPTTISGNGRTININEINVSSNDPEEWVNGLEQLSIIRK